MKTNGLGFPDNFFELLGYKRMTPCPKQITYKSKKYLNFVRRFPCCVCSFPDTEAHHIRFSHNSGTGMKPPDTWAIPLCNKHHREFHDKGITTFQKIYEVDIYQQLFLIAKGFIEENFNKATPPP